MMKKHKTVMPKHMLAAKHIMRNPKHMIAAKHMMATRQGG